MASEGFGELFDLPADEMQKILSDDVALMLFGFRRLRRVLFGEFTIAVRQDVATSRLVRAKERNAQLEFEAVERQMRDEQRMNGGGES